MERGTCRGRFQVVLAEDFPLDLKDDGNPGEHGACGRESETEKSCVGARQERRHGGSRWSINKQTDAGARPSQVVTYLVKGA